MDFNENFQLFASHVPEEAKLLHKEVKLHTFFFFEFASGVLKKVFNGRDVFAGCEHGSVFRMESPNGVMFKGGESAGCQGGVSIDFELFPLLNVGYDHVKVQVVSKIVNPVHVNVLVDKQSGHNVEVSGGPFLVYFPYILNQFRVFFSCNHPNFEVGVRIVQNCFGIVPRIFHKMLNTVLST